jgi:hypothetical protein
MEIPLWIKEMSAEENKKIRAEVVAWVRSYSWHNKRRYQDVWNRLYALLERLTGEPLPEKDRLDWIELSGLMGKLYQATQFMK